MLDVEKMGKTDLNPIALGYALAILDSLSYLLLRITVKFFGYGTWALAALKGLVFSNNTADATIFWIIPEVLQIALLGFVGGYLLATLYNRFA